MNFAKFLKTPFLQNTSGLFYNVARGEDSRFLRVVLKI